MQSDIEEAYGMGLTDSQAIADKYGRQVQAIDLIKNGKVNELIQLNPEYEERANKQNYRNVEDIETATARLKQDFERNNQRASELTTKTIDRLLADNTNASIKAIASAQATGSLGSGGFAYALSQVQKGYQRAIDDAWTNYEQYNDDQKLALNRGLEDYTTELERINYSMEEVRKNLQLQTLSTFQDIMTQQGLNTQKASQLLLEYQGKVEQIMYEANAEATKNLIDAHYDFSSRRVARLLCFTRTPIGEYPQLFAGLTSRMSLPRLV
ncbi:MAG: hypothetical protein LBU27_09990, partial [Candidatus Peribacteria bacterium]|nr:hypothetical protein [Candidatus Peribacteria bacterium]